MKAVTSVMDNVITYFIFTKIETSLKTILSLFIYREKCFSPFELWAEYNG